MQFLQILGALGLFLFGMKLMSQGIQEASGPRLKGFLNRAAQNRLQAICSGALITSIIQSSSATTVLVVSLVQAGILKVRDAIGVILGANLGTTTTFWLITFFGYQFSLTSLCPPIIGLGIPLYLINKRGSRALGQACIGFGLLFLGLAYLKDSVPDLRKDPDSLLFLQAWTDYGFASVLLFVVVGMLLTILLQSSSAAGAITIALTVQGWIPLEVSCAIILGENIGTTVTANLAALTGEREAKCAARAHLLFNVLGVCWMLLLFYPYLALLKQIVPASSSEASIALFLASFHSSFNLLNILLLFRFVPWLERTAAKLVRSKASASTALQY